VSPDGDSKGPLWFLLAVALDCKAADLVGMFDKKNL